MTVIAVIFALHYANTDGGTAPNENRSPKIYRLCKYSFRPRSLCTGR
jgi:hypothetical protein